MESLYPDRSHIAEMSPADLVAFTYGAATEVAESPESESGLAAAAALEGLAERLKYEQGVVSENRPASVVPSTESFSRGGQASLALSSLVSRTAERLEPEVPASTERLLEVVDSMLTAISSSLSGDREAAQQLDQFLDWAADTALVAPSI